MRHSKHIHSLAIGLKVDVGRPMNVGIRIICEQQQ